MRVYCFAFGKLKTPGLRDTIDHYKRHLSPWIEFIEEELKPIPVPDKSPATRLKIQNQEAELLENKFASRLSSRAWIYLLDEKGKALPTQGWSQLVNTWENQSIPEVAWCIGSSLGFHSSLHKRAKGILSFGPQTLPHELARVLLTEQLFRAWSITRNHPYHVEG